MSIYHKTFPSTIKSILGVLVILLVISIGLPFLLTFLILGIPLAILLYLPTLGWSWGLVGLVKNEWKFSKDPDRSYFNRYMNSILGWCFGNLEEDKE